MAHTILPHPPDCPITAPSASRTQRSFDHRCFGHCGWSCLRLGFKSRVQSPPAEAWSNFHPAAFSDTPLSSSRMNVWMRLYPSSLPILAAAAYSAEQAFLVPSVTSRVTSSTSRWLVILAVGRPTDAPPTILPSCSTPIENLCPCTGLWWRCRASTNSFRSRSSRGTIFIASQNDTLSLFLGGICDGHDLVAVQPQHAQEPGSGFPVAAQHVREISRRHSHFFREGS